jgi:hypothetical protein
MPTAEPMVGTYWSAGPMERPGPGEGHSVVQLHKGVLVPD